MTKLMLAMVARILAAQTDNEWNEICGDVDVLYQADRIKFDDHEMLYRLIDRLHK